MEYTLTEAAQATGLSRPTIFRAIKKGFLSARREADRSYRIDGSELARVYPGMSTKRQSETSRHAKKQEEQTETTKPAGTDFALLRLRLEMLEGQVAREREVANQVQELADRERETFQETIVDLRKRLDHAEERVLALTTTPDPSTIVTEPAEVMPPVRAKAQKGLLARIFGQG